MSGSFGVSLNPMQSKLFELGVSASNGLAWSATGNSGVWDAGTSANWINLSNSQATVFDAGDAVTFDDTTGCRRR